MNKILTKVLTAILIPFTLSVTIVGVGFSLWNFNEENNNSINKNISISTTDLGSIATLTKNYTSSSIEENDNSTNYIVADETSIKFLYNYYIHFNLLARPISGSLDFKFTLKVKSKEVELDENVETLLINAGIMSATEESGTISIEDMIYARCYLANGQNDLQSSGIGGSATYDTDPLTIDFSLLDTSYYPTGKITTDEEGYKNYEVTWYFRHGINYPYSTLDSFYVCSDDQIFMTYTPIYNKLMNSKYSSTSIKLNDGTSTTLKEYIVSKAREVLTNTSCSISYWAEWKEDQTGEYN